MNFLPNRAQALKSVKVILPYAESLALVFAMADVHLKSQAFMDSSSRYTLLLLGVCYGVWRGGKGPALVALATSCFLGAYVFSPPQFSLKFSSRSDVIVLFLYLIVGVAITIFGEAMRIDRQRVLDREMELRIAHEQLAEANAKLTEMIERRNEDLREIRRYIAEEI